MTDLVQRLREDAEWQRKVKGGTTNHGLLDQAADLIEVLTQDATEEMTMAARGLIMARGFGLPNYTTSLGDVAKSGFYGEYWRHILTDEEKEIKYPLPKAHFADLIWRAMRSAALGN